MGAVDVAIEFIEKINRRDFRGLQSMVSPDFLSIAANGETGGGVAAAGGIEQYTIDWPDFQIHISDVYVNGDTISIVGRTTGSCDDESRGVEIRKRVLYQIAVENTRARSFRYAVPDTLGNRVDLGIADADRITA